MKIIGTTRLYAPMLRPELFPLNVGHQYDLFVPTAQRSAAYGSYVPAWIKENRPTTNPDKRVFVPPTVIQLDMAIKRIEERTKGAPRARSRALGALSLFVQGYSLCDVMLYVHAGHVFAMCRRFFQLALKRMRPRELLRQLRVETMLTYSAPGTAFGACRAHLNGF